MKNILCRCSVRRYRNIINNSYAEQSFYVGVMRLHLQRIPKEDDQIDFSFRDFRTDLLIPAERPGQKLFNGQFRCLFHQSRRMPRTAQIALFERLDIGKRSIDDFLLFIVVRYQRNRFHLLVKASFCL